MKCLLIVALAISASAQECSTEKVNGDCTITIDRLYPVTSPTIQMRRGKRVTVVVANPLQFETLTLDPQSAQALAGSDQSAALLNALIPITKGFGEFNDLLGPPLRATAPPPPETPTLAEMQAAVEKDLKGLDAKLKPTEDLVKILVKQLEGVYLQLQEVLAPVPRPGTDTGPYAALRASGTPDPLTNFTGWRQLLLCELIGKECDHAGTPLGMDLVDVIQSVTFPANKNGKLSWSTSFDELLDTTSADIAQFPPAQQAEYNARLALLLHRESALSVYSNLQKPVTQDFNTYGLNIALIGTASLARSLKLGDIYDPTCPPGSSSCRRTLLGTQVVFVVNAVNQVAVPLTSTPSASQKKSITTITVIYADPIFEVSSGVFFSTLPNRSFSNITQINPGTPPTQGNVIIAQTTVRPTIVPYVGANWRLNYDQTWPGGRRRAWYFTTAVGLNPNNTLAEFAFGPSVSWRAIMFSALYHLGHDTRLTQGETVGEIWCNQTAKTCSPTPPNPSTEKYWTGAFAFGIGIRVPTTFGGSSK